ncbi:MAG: AAA family ATPase, partial [Planctomycetales bacterium]|nr:AAA family ATPase [Planctomycetales bacterium]
MIDRLLSLELKNFRGYRDPVKVPLDADVVLIHGPNGCGKSSLLQALEFAVTGDVTDLSPFEDSYPRCLQNVGVKSPPRVTLRYRSERGDEVEQSASKPAAVEGQKMSKRDTAFFGDRCYLSQARLGRLLELYQAVDKDHPEAPLVTFIRELLGLNYLEHLTAGLDEIGLITRVRKNLPALQHLEDAREEAGREIERLQENFRTRAVTLTAEIEECRKIALEDSGDPVPLAPWTVAGVRQRLGKLRSYTSNDAGSSLRDRLQQDQARLALIAEFVNVGSSPGDISLDELRQREAAARHVLEILESQLVTDGDAVSGVLRELDVATTERPAPTGIVVWLEQLEAVVQRELTRRQEDIAATEDRHRELQLLNKQLESATAELHALPLLTSPPGNDPAVTWIATLKTVLDHVHDDACPVCGRDYSELRAGDLRSRLVAEIRLQESQAGELVAAMQRRSEREQKVADLARNLDRTRSVAAPDIARGDAARERVARLQPFAERLSQARPSRDQWQQTLAEIGAVGGQLRNAEIAQEQHAKYRQQIEELADRWELSQDRPADANRLVHELTDLLQ